MSKPSHRESETNSPARRDTLEPRDLLARILDTPALARAVPQLPAEVLERVIETCGLEDCGALIALTTPAQLSAVFDLDLWHNARPGLEEQFDADRFGVWLEVLAESGGDVAAQRLSTIDPALVTMALAQYISVFDAAALTAASTDGDDIIVTTDVEADLSCAIGGYRIVAKRNDAWDAIASVLASLDDQHADYFHRVMRGCRSLSDSGREIDGLDDLLEEPEQAMFDVAFLRERRREEQGYLTPEQARAFLNMSRSFDLRSASAPARNPIATAYFQSAAQPTDAIPSAPAAAAELPAATVTTPEESAAAVAAIVDVLVDAGVIPARPRALLEGPPTTTSRLTHIEALMQSARERGEGAYASRSQELVYLANAVVSGCSLQARPLTTQEGYDAAVATCNLGLEHWPERWPAPEDLVAAFQVGWTILHEDVCIFAATGLIDVLSTLHCRDREIQQGLRALKTALVKHTRTGMPWHAREAFDVLTSLDMPSWAALLGLIDECPVLHEAVGAAGARSVSPTAFVFISESGQIASVRAFMASLPDRLRE